MAASVMDSRRSDMYVDVEYALTVGKWLIDTALPDDNAVSRKNLRDAFYKAFENRIMLRTFAEDEIIKPKTGGEK